MPFLHERMLIMQVSLVMTAAAATAAQLALPNCQDKCGDVTIPYPFGVTKKCYMAPEFFIRCAANGKAFLRTTNIPVTNISVDLGEIQVQQDRAYDCYDELGNNNNNNNAVFQVAPPYTISGTKNKFIAVGCDTYATFRGYSANQERFITGCMSLCDSLNSVEQDSCSGIGCCQTSIPNGLINGTVMVSSYYNHTYIWSFNPCSYAFVVQEGHFRFSNSTSFQQLYDTAQLPMILNWEIGNEPCDAAQEATQNSICKAHSKCVKPNNRSTGYICQCLKGYEGNPYHPNGCQDIDECKASNSCSIGVCVNSPGDYSCECPKGYKNDGMNPKSCIKECPKGYKNDGMNPKSCIKECPKGYKNDGMNPKGCINDNRSKTILLLIISLGVSGGLLILLGAISSLYCGLQRRKFIKLKEKYFKENGGLLLEQHLASQGGSMETTRIFTAEALEKATNNYHESRVLGEGGYGTVYKGILADNKVVAIKKSKIGASTQKEQFVNEMIVLSQINHRNVVRLLGCCLETPVPLLVYEFVTNGTLFAHIHNIKDKRSSLPWGLRMKIATETSGALAYLHSSTSMPIIHRDVKTTNILLDENYTAKVSDFGASKLIPVDQTQLTTLVQGTFGYLDPEYFLSNQLTEKSDVYSFGVVLAELLTSRVALCFDRPEAERNLANFFVCSVEEDRFNQILDDDIVNDGNIETLKNVAILAKRCLRLQGEERPTMKEVALELEGMRIMAKHPWGKADCPEETEHLLGSRKSDAYRVDVTAADCGNPSGTSSGYDSMQIQMLTSYGDGR